MECNDRIGGIVNGIRGDVEDRVERRGVEDRVVREDMEDEIEDEKKYDIIKDLAGYRIPTPIKDKANELARRLKLEKRKGKRKKILLYFLIKSAYAEKGWICDPKIIGAELELSKKDINSSNSTYHEAQINYTPPTVSDFYGNYIPYYLYQLGIDNIQQISEQIQNYCFKLLDETLQKKFPHDLALACILHYLHLHGYGDRKDTIESLKRSPIVITNIIKILGKNDNK